MPQGMGCHLEGQAACCSDTPTRLRPSHLKSCFGFFYCIFVVVVVAAPNPALCSGWAVLAVGHELFPRRAEPQVGAIL